jgi:hypothetical protein
VAHGTILTKDAQQSAYNRKLLLSERQAHLPELGRGIARTPAPMNFAVSHLKTLHRDEFTALDGRLQAAEFADRATTLDVTRSDNVAFCRYALHFEPRFKRGMQLAPDQQSNFYFAPAQNSLDQGVVR